MLKLGLIKNLNHLRMNMPKITPKMKHIAMCLIIVSCLGTSCTSLQQTTVAATDDLYYAPNTTESEKQNIASSNNQSGYESQDQTISGVEQTYPDDRYLRLKVANRYRWDAIDDFGYWNDPRYNYAYYPSYYGWNSWYSGIYGNSWYNPFGFSLGFGWGGYSPFISSYYNMGWGWGLGFDDFGYYGLGYGYGWNPYYYSYWNPYASYYAYYGGGYYGGLPARRIHFQDPNATHTSMPGLTAFRNASSGSNYNNYVNTTNGSTRYTGNTNLNTNFGALLKRVTTTNTNTNYANSWDRPARSFNSNNTSNQYKIASSNNSTNYSIQSNGSANAGGRSGGFNSSSSSGSSSGRAPRNN
jgi:hypothetical protein